MENNQNLTLQEAAEMAKVSRQTINSWINKEVLSWHSGFKGRLRKLIKKEDLLKIIKDRGECICERREEFGEVVITIRPHCPVHRKE